MNKEIIKANNVKELFESQAVQSQLARAVPSVLNVDKLMRISLSVIRNNSRLLECSQASLLTCVMGAAQLGLTPEPFLGQCYFVPYWNSGKKGYEATLIPGYRGYITLARRSGELATLSAQMVYSNDTFEYSFGVVDNLYHVLAEGDRGTERGAWTVFKYKDNTHSFDYMQISDIKKIMERSKSKDKSGNLVGPWVTDFDQMAIKTVIRRHVKLAPLAVEDLSKAVQAENMADAGLDQGALFMPDDDKPIEIETGPNGAEVFDQKIKAWAKKDKEELNKFMDQIIEHLDRPIDEIKADAVEDWDGFRAQFNAWRKKEADKKILEKEEKASKKGEKPEDPVWMESNEFNELMLEKETNPALYRSAIDALGEPEGKEDCVKLLNYIDKSKEMKG